MKTLVMIGCLLLTVPAAAQTTTTLGTGETGTGGTPYVGTLTATFQTTYSVCGSGVPASNCWQTIAAQPSATLVNLGVANDGDMWGTTAAGALYHLAPKATAWTHVSGSAVQIVPLGLGVAYSLNSSGHIGYTTNGGSSWTTVFSPYPTFFRQITISPDGGLVMALGEAVGCGYRVYRYDLTNNVWVSDTQMLTYASAISSINVWGVCTGNVPNADAYHFDGNNWSQWTLDTGIGAAYIVAVGNNLNTEDGGTLFAGTNDFWYRNEKDVNGYMTHLTGSPNFVAGVSEDGIYGLFGATVKKFQAHTLQFTHNIAGQYNSDGCVPGPHNTCPNIYHTGPMTMQISGHAQQSYTFNVLMTDQVNVNLSDSFTPAEMYQCENGGSCPSIESATHLGCTVIGAGLLAYDVMKILLEAGSIKPPHPCYTREKLNLDYNSGKPYGCENVYSNLYDCKVPVEAWCSNTYTPDLDPGAVREFSRSSTGIDIYAPPGQTWENKAWCFSFTGGPPWEHSEDLAIPAGNSVGLGPAPDCTVTQ